MVVDLATLDIRSLDERAVRDSIAFVSRVTDADLARSTPCAGWTLRDLIDHMAVQHDGFAAAANGTGGDPLVWQTRQLADPVADYAAAAERVIAAFGGDGVLDRRFTLAEIRPDLTFSARTAIGFHCIDYVVHSWDVARSLGLRYEPGAALADAALALALTVPDGPEREQAGAAFRPSVPVAGGDQRPTIERVVAMLGRDPDWPGGPSRSDAAG